MKYSPIAKRLFLCSVYLLSPTNHSARLGRSAIQNLRPTFAITARTFGVKTTTLAPSQSLLFFLGELRHRLQLLASPGDFQPRRHVLPPHRHRCLLRCPPPNPPLCLLQNRFITAFLAHDSERLDETSWTGTDWQCRCCGGCVCSSD